MLFVSHCALFVIMALGFTTGILAAVAYGWADAADHYLNGLVARLRGQMDRALYFRALATGWNNDAVCQPLPTNATRQKRRCTWDVDTIAQAPTVSVRSRLPYIGAQAPTMETVCGWHLLPTT